jgi:hypothetical protein
VNKPSARLILAVVLVALPLCLHRESFAQPVEGNPPGGGTPCPSGSSCSIRGNWTGNGNGGFCTAASGNILRICEGAWGTAGPNQSGRCDNLGEDVMRRCFDLISPTDVYSGPCGTPPTAPGFKLAPGYTSGGSCCWYQENNGEDAGWTRKPLGRDCSGTNPGGFE